jgi:hypothetical protein
MVVEDAIMIVMIPALAGWVLWLVFRHYQLRIAARTQRTETFNRLIDKFSTAKEFVDFLQSDAGRKFMEDPLASPAHPLTSVRRFLLGGIILTVLGGALMLNALRLRGQTDVNYINQALGLNYWGTIFVGGGIALMIVAAVSYQLARRWR